MAAGRGAPSTVKSGSSSWSPRSRCMKKGSSPAAIRYSRPRSRSLKASSRFTAASRLWAARTVSTSRCPAESSSSSRSPSARSPSGPGFRALMNMLGIETGPEISMPGLRRLAGTGGTLQAPVLASLVGRCPGSIPCFSARASTSARLAMSARTRGVNSSWSRTTYSTKSGVKRASAPSTGVQRARPAAGRDDAAGADIGASLPSVWGLLPGAPPATLEQALDAEVGEGVLEVRERALQAAYLLAGDVFQRQHHATVAGLGGADPVVDLVAVENDHGAGSGGPCHVLGGAAGLARVQAAEEPAGRLLDQAHEDSVASALVVGGVVMMAHVIARLGVEVQRAGMGILVRAELELGAHQTREEPAKRVGSVEGEQRGAVLGDGEVADAPALLVARDVVPVQ